MIKNAKNEVKKGIVKASADQEERTLVKAAVNVDVAVAEKVTRQSIPAPSHYVKRSATRRNIDGWQKKRSNVRPNSRPAPVRQL